MDDETRDLDWCVWHELCDRPAAYLVTYEGEVDFGLCVDHTAEARANDPLDYIVGVRSLRPSELCRG